MAGYRTCGPAWFVVVGLTDEPLAELGFNLTQRCSPILQIGGADECQTDMLHHLKEHNRTIIFTSRNNCILSEVETLRRN